MDVNIYESSYLRNEDFTMIENGTNYIYINYDQALWFKTDANGKNIIDRCDGKITLNEVFEEVSKEKGIPAYYLKELCSFFIEHAILETVLFKASTAKEDIYPTYDQMEPNYPENIWIHVTSECNLFCPFCYSSSGGHTKYQLEYDDIVHFLSTIPEEKRKSIVISGGEPLLYQGIEPLVRCIKEELSFQRLTIITNGTIGSERYQNIAPYVDILQFSIDSPNKEIYELTRGKDNFSILLKSIEIAKEVGIPQRVASFTPTVNNIDTLPDMPQFCSKHSISGIHISKYMPVGRGEKSIHSLKVEPEKYAQVISDLFNNYKKVNEEIRIKRQIYELAVPENERTQEIALSIADNMNNKIYAFGKRLTCGMGTGIISVNYNGNIYVCPSLHHDEFMIGNLHEHIDSVMKKGKEIAETISVDSTKTECHGCKYKYICGGGCKAVSYAENGIYAKNSECDSHQQAIDYAILMANI